MKAYIGCKIVQAEPMDQLTFKKEIKGEHHEGVHATAEGYLVVYPDGYKSWSPKGVFEIAYREVEPEEVALVAGG